MISLPRFFIDKNDIDGEKVYIRGNDYNHIARSLRLQPGDRIVACTGAGMELMIVLTDFTDDYAAGKIIKREKSRNEPVIKITVAQAIPKNRNMELVIQKCTEIGVYDIIPLQTERTIVELYGNKKQRRLQRWHRLAEEAAKQSHRARIPGIKDIHNLEDVIDISSDFDIIFILWEQETETTFADILREIDKNCINNILLIVGPEGGFAEKEVNLIKSQAGGYSLSLGPRILRTETAAFVGLTILLYEFGEMRC